MSQGTEQTQPGFQGQGVTEAVKDEETVAHLATRYQVPSSQIQVWKKASGRWWTGSAHNCPWHAGVPCRRLRLRDVAVPPGRTPALVSMAPFNRDSGTLRDKRTVWGGRARTRTALYMGAMVASRFNPVIRDFYQRLLSAGKPKKPALTACMRKLLIILNSMLKHGSSWNHPATRSLTHSH